MSDHYDDRERRQGTADLARAADAGMTDGAAGNPFEREVEIRSRDDRGDDSDGMRLLPDDVVEDLRPRWADIQASFVDQPRRAVEQADALVADAIHRLSEAFAGARSSLEREWDRGEDVSTEDLRLAFRRYRTFFDRLLET